MAADFQSKGVAKKIAKIIRQFQPSVAYKIKSVYMYLNHFVLFEKYEVYQNKHVATHFKEFQKDQVDTLISSQLIKSP